MAREAERTFTGSYLRPDVRSCRDRVRSRGRPRGCYQRMDDFQNRRCETSRSQRRADWLLATRVRRKYRCGKGDGRDTGNDEAIRDLKVTALKTRADGTECFDNYVFSRPATQCTLQSHPSFMIIIPQRRVLYPESSQTPLKPPIYTSHAIHTPLHSDDCSQGISEGMKLAEPALHLSSSCVPRMHVYTTNINIELFVKIVADMLSSEAREETSYGFPPCRRSLIVNFVRIFRGTRTEHVFGSSPGPFASTWRRRWLDWR